MKPGGNTHAHGGRNLTRLASAKEMFVALVATVRVDGGRLHVDSGGGSTSVGLLGISGDKNKARVTSEAVTSAGACRCRSAKSVIGVASLSEPPNFSTNSAVSRAAVDSRALVDHGSADDHGSGCLSPEVIDARAGGGDKGLTYSPLSIS